MSNPYYKVIVYAELFPYHEIDWIYIPINPHLEVLGP